MKEGQVEGVRKELLCAQEHSSQLEQELARLQRESAEAVGRSQQQVMRVQAGRTHWW